MKLLYLGPFWEGSTSLQRLEAFRRIGALQVVAVDTGHRVGKEPTFWSKLRWKLGWPVDRLGENERLLLAVERERPDTVLIESKVIRPSTLSALRRHGVRSLALYTPDNILGSQNLTWPLRLTFGRWDVLFTTKSFNVDDLAKRGVRRPILVGKAYDPLLHRPMTTEEVGPDYERFDLVFIGTYERERCASINKLAESGFSVVLYGSGWSSDRLAPTVSLRPSVYHMAYVRCMHHGRLALCFLRKINRDLVTQRSVEIPAMARPMLAERTLEHDEYFKDGIEYLGFSNDDELLTCVRRLLSDVSARANLGRAGRQRCLSSAYSTDDRAQVMLAAMEPS